MSGPNARLWQIFLFGIIFFFIGKYQLLLVIFFYGIFVWSILAVLHFFTQRLIFNILKKNKNLFLDCFEENLVIVRLKSEDYHKLVTLNN